MAYPSCSPIAEGANTRRQDLHNRPHTVGEHQLWTTPYEGERDTIKGTYRDTGSKVKKDTPKLQLILTFSSTHTLFIFKMYSQVQNSGILCWILWLKNSIFQKNSFLVDTPSIH